VVEQVDLLGIPYVHLELWELAGEGKAIRRHIAPVRREGGRLNAADLAVARATLERDARRAGLRIIAAAW